MKYVILAASLLCLANPVMAEEGDFGVEVDTSTTGLFPPRLEFVTVAVVKEGSSAFKAGIKQGDKIVSIANCVIPGCSAFEAMDLMEVDKGKSQKFGIVQGDEQVRYIDLKAE